MLLTVLDVLAASEDGVEKPFTSQTQQLFQLISNLINDPESLNIRTTGVRALGTAATYIDVENGQEAVRPTSFRPMRMESRIHPFTECHQIPHPRRIGCWNESHRSR